MSKMIVANCTKQHYDFTYRLPEVSGLRRQRIPIGQQVVLSDELTTPDIEAIIKQHAVYGFVHVSEIDRVKPFIGLCYDLDKRIRVDDIINGLQHNQDVLIARGQDIRRRNAVSLNNEIENALAEQVHTGLDAKLRELEITIEEEEKAGAVKGEDDNLVEEGIRVNTVDVNEKEGMRTHESKPLARSAGGRRR